MRIHIFINCHWNEGISGGDKRVLEIIRRWKEYPECEMFVYTSKSFQKLMVAEGVTGANIQICLTDLNVKQGTNIINTYHIRQVNAFRIAKKNFQPGDYLYSPTDILPDVVPAYKLKKLFPLSRWTMTTYHIFEKFYKRPGNIAVNFLSCSQQKLAIRMGLKSADAYPTISPVVLEEFQRIYPMKKDIFFLSGNAVDTDSVEGANLTTDSKGNCIQEFDAVFLARLNYSKGIMELPEIWKRVIAIRPGAKLALMGKGTPEITRELKDKIVSCGVEDSIQLFGYVENDFAHSVMKKSKLFLFTSHEEGWGMALAEALLCRIPVVAYNLPVFQALFPEGTTLCPLKDVDAMAKAVIDLLDDEMKRETLGKAGHDYVKMHYSWEKTAQDEIRFVTGNLLSQ